MAYLIIGLGPPIKGDLHNPPEKVNVIGEGVFWTQCTGVPLVKLKESKVLTGRKFDYCYFMYPFFHGFIDVGKKDVMFIQNDEKYFVYIREGRPWGSQYPCSPSIT